MALTTMLRRSAASAAPLAMRLVGRIRHHTSAGLLLSAVKHGGARRFFPSAVHFSTDPARVSSSEKTLIKVLDSEIADEEEDLEDAEDIPEDFPFKIEDNESDTVVKLTRQYEGERVEVEVYGLESGGGDNEDDDDKDDDDSSQTLTLVVKISKVVGPYLEFKCKATPDEISIEDLELKDPEATDELAYVGPYFVALDEVIQKAFHKYLAARGITTSAMNYMHGYMKNKETREYKIWLEHLKKFVEA